MDLHNEYLENTVFNIPMAWKPLQSSFQTGSSVGGNPGVGEDNLSPNGEVTVQQDSNNPDNRV